MVNKTPQGKKTKTAVAETVKVEDKPSTANVVEIKDDESLLGFGESWDNYKLSPIRRRTTTSTPSVEPFLKSTVLDVMQVMYEKKQGFVGIKALGKREGRILSGMLIGEFVKALDQIVPDNYTPKGRNKKDLKNQKPKTWKLSAINEPSIRDKLKRFLADGDLIVFKVDKNRYMYCLATTFMKTENYVGSIWHLLQIKEHIFQNTQWEDSASKKGHRNWFIPNPFFDLPLVDLESLLTLKEKEIWTTWDKEKASFNVKTIAKLIKPVKVESS